jgi:hypothetical protein
MATDTLVMHRITHSEFLARVRDAFPDLSPDLDSVAAYPTLQAAVLAQRLQRAKGEGDWDCYERGIRLVAEALRDAEPELARTLGWSFVKGLDFEGTRGPIAWALLPPELQRAWAATRRKLDALSALPRKLKGRRR